MYKDKIIAVVGVSENTKKFGYRILKDLLKSGFNVLAVGIKDGSVDGEKIYKTLKDLPQKPDVILTVVPPVVTEKITETAIASGIKEIWMQPGSQSKTATQKAREKGVTVINDKCFMEANGIW
jgi:predicted CoA-binding protein